MAAKTATGSTYTYGVDPISGRRVKVPKESADKKEKKKTGRPKLDEATLAATVNVTARIPLVAWDAVDLIAQYDRVSRVETLRAILWSGIRSRVSSDRRLQELLESNNIDVAPVNLIPRRFQPNANDKPDPLDLL